MAPKKERHKYEILLAAPETEINLGFIQGMVNRMAVSYHKYGAVADATNVAKLDSAQQRIDLYLKTGNTEYLMDAANFLMMEFMHPQHPNAHFEATDSDGSPGRTRLDGSVDDKRNK